jgi:low temperature requirement protein LtrA
MLQKPRARARIQAPVTTTAIDAATTGRHGRKVTWLELFFDLIFVAAITQVAEPLREHYSFAELARLTPLFLLICWAWKGQAVFATRFGGDAVADRAVTLVQMFTVAALAANAKDALDSESTAGFVAAYAVMRLILVAQYAGVRRSTHARALVTRYLAGHGMAAALWLASAFLDAPLRYAAWALAAAIDFGTPWLSLPHTVDLPPDRAHLPERLGLFMLILLGDAVIAVMQGMESQDGWTPDAAVSAFLGMAILFAIWWWYFDGAAGAAEQHVATRRDALRLHIWSYAHLPLYLGVIVVGVGLRRLVTAASHAAAAHEEVVILTVGAAGVMLALALVGQTSGRRVRRAGVDWSLQAAVATMTLAAGAWGGVDRPLAVSVLLTAMFGGQLAAVLSRRVRSTDHRALAAGLAALDRGSR